jgi:hypothetical protein
MNTRILTVLITLAFLGFSVTAIAKGKPVKPGDGDPVYTAQLTTGEYFDFVSGDLTTARKGKSLPGNGPLGVSHNGNSPEGDIFRKYCSTLLTEVGIEAFEVLENNWGISHTKSRGGPDQIHITMNNLIIDPLVVSKDYSQVDFDLHLHGEIAEGKDFLPESDNVAHTLTRYMLWAGGHGEEGWFICNSTGGGMDSWELLPQDLTLTITLK